MLKLEEEFGCLDIVGLHLESGVNLLITELLGHSWAPLFGRNEQQNNGNVMIAMLSDVTTNFLPNFTSLSTPLFQDEINPLKSIDKVDPAHVNGVALADGKQYIRVGAATTNERFRRWCLTEGQVTLPMNIIEVEITMGGANAPIW